MSLLKGLTLEVRSVTEVLHWFIQYLHKVQQYWAKKCPWFGKQHMNLLAMWQLRLSYNICDTHR